MTESASHREREWPERKKERKKKIKNSVAEGDKNTGCLSQCDMTQ